MLLKKFSCLLLLICSCFANAQEKEFDYNNIILVAAIKDDKNCVFAGFPTFITMRDIISNTQRRFGPTIETPSTFIYELFLVDKNGASTTLFLGNHWLSDGVQISQLSDTDFSFLTRVISARKFENDNSRLDSWTLDVNVATLKNELLKTGDYESVGRQPSDDHTNPELEPPAQNSSTKPVDDGSRNTSDSTNAIGKKSSPVPPKSATQKPDILFDTSVTARIQNSDQSQPEKTLRNEVNDSNKSSITAAAILIIVIGILYWRLRKK